MPVSVCCWYCLFYGFVQTTRDRIHLEDNLLLLQGGIVPENNMNVVLGKLHGALNRQSDASIGRVQPLTKCSASKGNPELGQYVFLGFVCA